MRKKNKEKDSLTSELRASSSSSRQQKWIDCRRRLAFEPLEDQTLLATVASGFDIQVFANVGPNLTSLAFPPAGSAFGSDLYVATGISASANTEPDECHAISPTGTVTPFATLQTEADPNSLEFPPAGSPFAARNIDRRTPSGPVDQCENV